MRVIASHNGRKATTRAWKGLVADEDLLDAVVAGLTEIEDDEDELTVGFGGLPNEDGIVELDAAVMDGRTHRAGAVAGLRDIRHAARVAQLVMQQTNRVLLVGEGARQFALANGFPTENLLTPRARQMWLYWKRSRSHCDDWLAPPATSESLDVQRWFERHFYAPPRPGDESENSASHSPVKEIEADKTGTVHCAALDRHGNLAAGTSTSGHAFKLAGRVGDSPIIGAGLYVDRAVGTCGSIGHGEANMENCTAFACVELMRQGKTPQESAIEVLQRVVEKTRPGQRDELGRPDFNLLVFAMNLDGAYAGASIWSGKSLAVTDEQGTRLEPCTPLYECSATPGSNRPS